MIKIKSPVSETPEKLGFYFYNASDRKLVWILEEDTLDSTFRDSEEFGEFDQNVEIKTHPTKGFILSEIHNIIGDMEDTIVHLYRNALATSFNVTPHELERLHHSKYIIRPKNSTQTQFLIKSKVLPP